MIMSRHAAEGFALCGTVVDIFRPSHAGLDWYAVHAL